MKIYPIICAALIAASPAWSGCYAEYKAKQDNPLRLHYGVIELPASACSVAGAQSVIPARIAIGGWELLQVMSIFGDDELASHQARTEDFFLRY